LDWNDRWEIEGGGTNIKREKKGTKKYGEDGGTDKKREVVMSILKETSGMWVKKKQT